MHAISDFGLVLHKIRMRYHKNNLLNGGDYYLRTASDRTLSTEDIVLAMRTRGGFTGSYEDAVEIIRLYNLEKAYQLCDGYAVSDSFTVIYPHISGSFNSPNGVLDPEKNKLGFRVKALARLRKLVKNITIEIEGIAQSKSTIYHLSDYEDGGIGFNKYLPGNMVAIYGIDISIAGDSPENGVYFVAVDDPSNRVKMTRMADNLPGKVSGIAPDTHAQLNRIEIRTQYNGSKNSFLKEPRVLISTFTIETL